MILPSLPQTTAAVALHYDELDAFYREIWGEHVHHGYWATGRETPEEAAQALIDLVAARLGVAPGQKVCDIGCGYGATARQLAERHGLEVVGVTVSAAQARLAAARAPRQGRVTILLQDWLTNELPAAGFDRAYAIESSEHMPDKQRFFDEAFRVLRPGGRLAVCAWLAGDEAKAWEIRHLLEPICREGRLPGMGTLDDYRGFGKRAGFVVGQVEDISARVRRTWSICAWRVLAKLLTEKRYRRFLLDASSSNRIFALTLLRLLLAYRTGAMRYVLLIYDKP